MCANAGIIVGLIETGGTSGTVSGGGILTPAEVTGMLGGLTYVNVHTRSFGGGLACVPRPIGPVLVLPVEAASSMAESWKTQIIGGC
jgi:hypothetical protein